MPAIANPAANREYDRDNLMKRKFAKSTPPIYASSKVHKRIPDIVSNG